MICARVCVCASVRLCVCACVAFLVPSPTQVEADEAMAASSAAQALARLASQEVEDDEATAAAEE